MRNDSQHKNFKITVELEKPEREDMQNAVGVADVVFYSKIWAEYHGHSSSRDFLETQLPLARPDALLCCTWGADGATAVENAPDGACNWSRAGIWKPDDGRSVLDTIGAGDTFTAGMLFSLAYHAEDWTLDEKLSFATELASRKVFQEGFQQLARYMI